MKTIAPRDYRSLPALEPPASYICLIRDEEYQDRFAIIRVQNLNEIDDFRNALLFDTTVEKVFELRQGAARIQRKLLQRYAYGDDWFTLNHAQLQEIDGMSRQQNRGRQQPRSSSNSRRRWRNLVTFFLLGLIVFVAWSMVSDPNGFTFDWLVAPSATATKTRIPPTAKPSKTPVPPSATSSITPRPPTTTPTIAPSATLIPPTSRPTITPSPSPVPPTSRPSSTPVPPTETSTSTPTDTPTDTPIPPTSTPTITPSATPTVIQVREYVIDTAGNYSANIRACPQTSCEILAKYPPGATVEVLGNVAGETVYETNVWLEVKLADGKGYIHSELAELPSPSQPSRPSENLERFATASRRYTHRRVNARSGPGTDYPLLDPVPAGAALDVVGQSGEWLLIRHGGAEAYIAAWLTYDEPLPNSG